MFKKYMHVERYGTDEVQGIELGTCYIFPKLDGTNGQLWWDNDAGLQAGSRNRHLGLGDKDNAGFYGWALQQERFVKFFKFNSDIRLYGEWLKPHSLRTYQDDAWGKFYVFDVERRTFGNEDEATLLAYEDYKQCLESFGIDYIPAISVIRSATYDCLMKEMQENRYLIKEGQGVGEGIVIKNYKYQNRFGRTVWAKMITNAFKEQHVKTNGPVEKDGKEMVEQKIVSDHVGRHLVDKTYAKIVNECDGWSSKYIPRLLNTVYHDLVTEEIWDAVKTLKNPTVNFKTLNTLAIMKVKELRPELF